MQVVARRQATESDVQDWLRTVPGFLSGLTEINGKPTVLTDYQMGLLLDESKFRSVEKARGVGISWLFAAESLAKVHLFPTHTGIFVSMNLDEAIEKVRYASLLYETLPLKWRKRKVVDNRTSLEFEDDQGRFRSRLVSHPCKEPRGKHEADVYLDEFAHYGYRQKGIYVAAAPIIARGIGRLTLASTPLGVGDLFHEIMKDERGSYPGFSRHSIPWWRCPEFCTDIDAAKAEAPKMTTEERVEKYAKTGLREVYQSMDLDDFRQEYELGYNDESKTYFPFELIFSCCADGLETYNTVDLLVESTSGDLYAGFDVGRTRNTSELVVLERGKAGKTAVRMVRSFDRTRFGTQKEFLRTLLKRSKRVRKVCVDKHGIGMNLAEDLHTEFRSRVEGVALVGQTKESLAVNLKIAMEGGIPTIPRDRELVRQIHSIKKSPTKAEYARFDVEGSKRHHADKFWALALAVSAAGVGREKRKRRQVNVTASII